MASDALAMLQNPVVQRNATGTHNSTELDLGATSPIRKPLWARVRYYGAKNSTGTNTVTFGIEDSADKLTFNDHVTAQPLGLIPETEENPAKSGIIYLPITGARRYVRLTCEITGTGISPLIQYEAWLGDSQ